MHELPVPDHFALNPRAVRNTPDAPFSQLIQGVIAQDLGRENIILEHKLISYLQRFYGDQAITVRESWRELKDLNHDGGDPYYIERERIQLNLIAIADLEVISPGIAKRLLEEDGIRNLGRYSRLDVLMQDYTNQQVKQGVQLQRTNTVLFFVSVHDRTGVHAFLPNLDMSPASREALKRAQFGIHIIESATKEESDERIAAYAARFGKQERAFLVLHAHGSPTSFMQARYASGRFLMEDFSEPNIGWRMLQRLSRELIVVICSCHATAETECGRNIAQSIFDLPNVTETVGPSDQASLEEIIFQDNEGVLSYQAIFDEGPPFKSRRTQGTTYSKNS